MIGAGNPFENGKVIVKITRIGVDLAKNLIVVHRVDSMERGVVSKAIPSQTLLEWFAILEPCLMAMEAICEAASRPHMRFVALETADR
jgi:transposase